MNKQMMMSCKLCSSTDKDIPGETKLIRANFYKIDKSLVIAASLKVAIIFNGFLRVFLNSPKGAKLSIKRKLLIRNKSQSD